MPRILRILNRLNLGGPAHNAAYLTKYLAPEFETLLLAGVKNEGEESAEFLFHRMGLQPQYLSDMKREINFTEDIISYYEIKKVIRTFRPDIVHTHAAKAGAIGRLAARACNVPAIVHTFHGHVFHSYFGKLKTGLFIRTERYLASKTDAVIAISQRQKKELSETYGVCPPSKTHVIPLGFDLEKFGQNTSEKRKQFREKYLLADDELAIGIIGRLVPVKNHSLFLKALKNISTGTTRKIRAFIIGDGELRSDIEHEAASLGIRFTDFTKIQKTELLTFTSWIKEIDVAIAGLDIIALTSLNEGTPVSLIEAQAGNKPIITTDAGGVRDVVIPRKTALVTENNNLNDFSEKLLELIENNNLRSELSSAGAAWAMENHSYTKLIESTGTLYRTLLKDKIK